MLLHHIHVLLLTPSVHSNLLPGTLVGVQHTRVIALMSAHAPNVDRVLQQLQTNLPARFQLFQLRLATDQPGPARSRLLLQTQGRKLGITKHTQPHGVVPQLLSRLSGNGELKSTPCDALSHNLRRMCAIRAHNPRRVCAIRAHKRGTYSRH